MVAVLCKWSMGWYLVWEEARQGMSEVEAKRGRERGEAVLWQCFGCKEELC